MSNRRFEMYQYRQIIVRLRAGESIRSIARSGLAGRRKIKYIYTIANEQGWLNNQSLLPEDDLLSKYLSEPQTKDIQQCNAKKYQEQIMNWANQGIKATSIHAALVRQHNYPGSYHSIRRLINKNNNTPAKVTVPLDFKPGECAQVNFGSGPKLIDISTGEIISTWIFVMILAFSRHQYAEIVLDQTINTWLKCHRHAFEFFGGVVNKVIIDNAKCAITKACYYDPQVQRAYAEYAEGYGFIISPCPPREPKKKGRVEASVKYIKTSFLPLREFKSLSDGNSQLTHWILETAGNRIHGSTHQKPLTSFMETERWLLKPLPDKPPELASWAKVKVHGDCHVQFAKCRYSVPHKLVGQLLWLHASESTIRVYQEHVLVALHSRLIKEGTRSTLNEHLPPHSVAYLMRDPQWCLKQAQQIGEHCYQLIKHLFKHTVLDKLRTAQGIIQLQNNYGQQRLNAACLRALLFDSPTYQTVKTILKKGLEYQQLPALTAFDQLAKSYTGTSIYCRDTSTLLIRH